MKYTNIIKKYKMNNDEKIKKMENELNSENIYLEIALNNSLVSSINDVEVAVFTQNKQRTQNNVIVYDSPDAALIIAYSEDKHALEILNFDTYNFEKPYAKSESYKMLHNLIKTAQEYYKDDYNRQELRTFINIEYFQEFSHSLAQFKNDLKIDNIENGTIVNLYQDLEKNIDFIR